jgi:hypothetical protein
MVGWMIGIARPAEYRQPPYEFLCFLKTSNLANTSIFCLVSGTVFFFHIRIRP